MPSARTLTIRVSDSEMTLLYTLIGDLSARKGRRVTQREAVLYAVQAAMEKLGE